MRGATRSRLRSLTFSDIAVIGSSVLSASLVSARLDADVLDIVINNLERLRREQEREQQLMAAGASQRLMEELTGMDGVRYAQFRKAFGLLGDGNGRPRDLMRENAKAADLREADRILQAWRGHEDREDIERWLAVHRATGHSLRTIERVVRSAELYGPDLAGLRPAVEGRPHGR